MKKRNLLLLEQTLQLEKVNFMHKYFNNVLPDAFDNFFQRHHRNCDTSKSQWKANIFPKFGEVN